jgi:membrane protease subunit (stomatin/prohibitin family)
LFLNVTSKFIYIFIKNSKLFVMSLLSRANKGRTFDGKESKRPGFIDRVTWEMQEEELVYKFPYDNLTTGTVLFVHESQKAFLFKDRVLYDSFGPGRHTLTTANIPFLQKFLNIPTGGETAFTAEVWYVNTELVKRNMPWGAGKLRIIDPYFQIPVKMGARGQYGFKISDAEVFLKKLVGTLHSVTTDKLYEQFRTDVIEGMKVHLYNYMKNNNLNVNELGGEYINISGFIKQELDSRFSEYGVELLNFNIEEIIIDENDEGYKKVLEGISAGVSAKLRREQLGADYREERQLDIMEQAAKNEGVAGGAMGLGLGFGAGNVMGNMMGNMQGQQQQQQPPQQAGGPPAAPPPPVAEIYLTKDGQTLGPYSVQQIQGFVSQQSVTKDSLVWKQGMQNWSPAESLPELQHLFRQAAPPPPPPPPSN